MSLWNDVRQAWHNPPDGIKPSLADLSRKFGPDYRVIKKMIKNPEPPGYQMQQKRHLRALGPHLDFIQNILHDDMFVRRKQRHSAARIYERLCDERNFCGSDRAVRRIVAKLKRKQRETYIPLAQPMSKGQADLCEVDVLIAGILTRVYVFVMALAYSDALFAMAFPFKKKEAWLEGHKQAFEYFGGVPKIIDLDNDKALVSKILSGHDRKMTEEFHHLVSYYCFRTHFCNVYRGNEKGIVENANKYIEKHVFTPIPSVRDFGELNLMLREWCEKHLLTTAKGKTKTRGELLGEERTEFIELPLGEYEACVKVSRKSDSLSLVNFQTNLYSVPDYFAGRDDLIMKGFWNKVEIFSRDNEHLATHSRLYKKHEESLNPMHYLETLSTKPGAIDHGRPFEKLELPECFGVLRRRLENEAELEAKGSKGKGGKHQGTRKFVQIIKLLLEFSMPSLKNAVEKALRLGHPQYEVVRQYCYPAECPEISVFELAGREHLAVYDVKKPELIKYNGLLNNFDSEKLEEIKHGQTASFTRALFERAQTPRDYARLQSSGKQLFEKEQ